jgi:glycosyltransferase involved in cell wall biosynthesis
MSKLPISVCIIAKDEEKYIEGCLKKLVPYGFEIIVTDTGSTDNTKNVAAKYADRLLDFKWTDDFSAARNFCASNASNNWILSIDCDEYVENIDINTLRMIMQKYPRYAGAIRLKNLIIAEDGHKGYNSDDVIRFYNKNFYRYQNPIHEQICPIDIKKDNQIQNVLLPIEAVHYGYLISPQQMEKKQKRNLRLLYKSLDKNPEDPYILFQTAQSELVLNNCEKAVGYYEKSLSLNDNTELIYVQILITSLAKAYVAARQPDKALKLMNSYSDRCKTAKFMFVHANVYMDNGMPLQALMTYVQTIINPDVDTLGENLLHCYENIMKLYNLMGQPQIAEQFRPKYEECCRERERITDNI